METQFLGEHKFLKTLQSILVDTFQYRVDLTPDQFVQMGFSERKMVLVLDVYDLVKKVRKQGKVHKRINNVDKRWEHPCDEALKDYAVCDHTDHTVKDVQFRMNPTLLKSKLEVKRIQKLDPVTH